MVQKLKYTFLITLISAACIIGLTAATPLVSYGQGIEKNVKCGVNFELDSTAGNCATTKAGCTAHYGGEDKLNAAQKKECDALDSGGGLEGVIDTVVNLLSVIVGIVAVIMIIIGGFKYITSGGDSNKVASAKNTIIYAIVGMIIAALAQVIARFVLSNV